MMFSESTLLTTSQPKTFAGDLDKLAGSRNRRLNGLEPPNVADPSTGDGSDLVKDWPTNHEPFPGIPLSTAPGCSSKEVPRATDTILEFLKGLSSSLEEVYSLASSDRPTSCGCSPVTNEFPSCKEPKTQTEGSFIATDEPQSIPEIHDLFESCAETITSLFDLVDRYPQGS